MATQQAVDLAKQNPGVEYAVLKHVTSVTAGDLVFKDSVE